jgi:hypothetical protein
MYERWAFLDFHKSGGEIPIDLRKKLKPNCGPQMADYLWQPNRRVTMPGISADTCASLLALSLGALIIDVSLPQGPNDRFGAGNSTAPAPGIRLFSPKQALKVIKFIGLTDEILDPQPGEGGIHNFLTIGTSEYHS